MENNKKWYVKKQFSGNLNGWDEKSGKEISKHNMYESQAEELNGQFSNTGVKYIETSAPDEEEAEVSKTATEHKEPEHKKPAAKSKSAVHTGAKK